MRKTIKRRVMAVAKGASELWRPLANFGGGGL
jgi:hypothetical protein